MLDDDAARLLLTRAPRLPLHEPMDGIVRVRLRQRQLVSSAVELVAAVGKSIGPRRQDLPTPGRTHLAACVPVEYITVADCIRTQTTAELDDHGALRSVHDLVLRAREPARLRRLSRQRRF